MFRFAPAFAVVGAVVLAVPALSADYLDGLPGDFRDGYKNNWDLSDAGDPLDFEFGARYFYSLGETQITTGAGAHTSNNTAHSLELHGRIDDNSTGTYLKGYAGYSGILYGTHNTPSTAGDVSIDAGQIGYGLVDFGYLGFGSDTFGFGPFIGYQYQGETTSTSTPDETITAGYNMLRLGLATRTDIGTAADINAEVALIPYARSTGSISTGPAIDATLAGVSGEVMLGFHATDNITIRGGGRALYLTDSFAVGNSSHSLLRYGGLLELTYSY